MKAENTIIVKLLGILLIIAAVLKGCQLLTVPMANNDIWSYRPFLILTVEFELALAIWLLSGLFKKAAKHLKNSEQNLLTGHFSHDDYEKVEEPEIKFEAIKRNN